MGAEEPVGGRVEGAVSSASSTFALVHSPVPYRPRSLAWEMSRRAHSVLISSKSGREPSGLRGLSAVRGTSGRGDWPDSARTSEADDLIIPDRQVLITATVSALSLPAPIRVPYRAL